MTYTMNPDGTITVVNSKKEIAQSAKDWADYSKDLNKSENS